MDEYTSERCDFFSLPPLIPMITDSRLSLQRIQSNFHLVISLNSIIILIIYQTQNPSKLIRGKSSTIRLRCRRVFLKKVLHERKEKMQKK